MRAKSYAKINLALDVLKKLENGYHEVRFVMQTITLCDDITVCAAEEISVNSNLPFIPRDSKNIAFRAAREFFDYTGIGGGASIYLDKKIPVGAGLGGGSSNGATVISALNDIYDARLTLPEMEGIAAKTGSDTAFFLTGGTCLAEGLGEVITPVTAAPKGWVLVYKPQFSISTKWVYENLNLDESTYHPDVDAVINAIKSGDIRSMAQSTGNTLERTVQKKYPQITQTKETIIKNGALGAIMSGSGSAVFGIFDSEATARRCAAKLKKPYDICGVYEFI